jgi:ankyrin repeat protein
MSSLTHDKNQYWLTRLANAGCDRYLLATMISENITASYKPIYRTFRHLSLHHKKDIDNPWELMCLNGDETTLEWIIKEYNLACEKNNVTNYNPLHLVALSGNVNALKKIIALGIDPHVKTQDERTLLHMTAQSGNKDAVQFAFMNSIDKNAINKKGENALHDAATLGHHKIMRKLVDSGIDPHLHTQNGTTVLHLAALSGKIAAIQTALSFGLDIHAINDSHENTLHFAARSGNPAAIQSFMELGVDSSGISLDGYNLLHYAATASVPAVKLALTLGMNIRSLTKTNKNVFMLAVEHNQADVLLYLTNLINQLPSGIQNQFDYELLLNYAYLISLDPAVLNDDVRALLWQTIINHTFSTQTIKEMRRIQKRRSFYLTSSRLPNEINDHADFKFSDQLVHPVLSIKNDIPFTKTAMSALYQIHEAFYKIDEEDLVNAKNDLQLLSGFQENLISSIQTFEGRIFLSRPIVKQIAPSIDNSPQALWQIADIAVSIAKHLHDLLNREEFKLVSQQYPEEKELFDFKDNFFQSVEQLYSLFQPLCNDLHKIGILTPKYIEFDEKRLLSFINSEKNWLLDYKKELATTKNKLTDGDLLELGKELGFDLYHYFLRFYQYLHQTYCLLPSIERDINRVKYREIEITIHIMLLTLAGSPQSQLDQTNLYLEDLKQLDNELTQLYREAENRLLGRDPDLLSPCTSSEKTVLGTLYDELIKHKNEINEGHHSIFKTAYEDCFAENELDSIKSFTANLSDLRAAEYQEMIRFLKADLIRFGNYSLPENKKSISFCVREAEYLLKQSFLNTDYENRILAIKNSFLKKEIPNKNIVNTTDNDSSSLEFALVDSKIKATAALTCIQDLIKTVNQSLPYKKYYHSRTAGVLMEIINFHEVDQLSRLFNSPSEQSIIHDIENIYIEIIMLLKHSLQDLFHSTHSWLTTLSSDLKQLIDDAPLYVQFVNEIKNEMKDMRSFLDNYKKQHHRISLSDDDNEKLQFCQELTFSVEKQIQKAKDLLQINAVSIIANTMNQIGKKHKRKKQ